jgi:hypothetical protein
METRGASYVILILADFELIRYSEGRSVGNSKKSAKCSSVATRDESGVFCSGSAAVKHTFSSSSVTTAYQVEMQPSVVWLWQEMDVVSFLQAIHWHGRCIHMLEDGITIQFTEP